METTDRFCAEHLDLEYAELCRRLIGRLARKRPSPLASGEVRTWAGGVLHAIGSLNFLFDRTQHPHLTASELCRLAEVSPATAARRSSEIRRLLRLTHFDPELSRREILEHSPLRNLVEVGGLIVPLDLLDPISDDALVESLDTADSRAVELLREALPELSSLPEPAALRHAATRLGHGSRASRQDRSVTRPWMIDELAHAGPEHLDPGFVAGTTGSRDIPTPPRPWPSCSSTAWTERGPSWISGRGQDGWRWRRRTCAAWWPWTSPLRCCAYSAIVPHLLIPRRGLLRADVRSGVGFACIQRRRVGVRRSWKNATVGPGARP